MYSTQYYAVQSYCSLMQQLRCYIAKHKKVILYSFQRSESFQKDRYGSGNFKLFVLKIRGEKRDSTASLPPEETWVELLVEILGDRLQL